MRRRCGRGVRRGSGARFPRRSRGPGPGTVPGAPSRNPVEGVMMMMSRVRVGFWRRMSR